MTKSESVKKTLIGLKLGDIVRITEYDVGSYDAVIKDITSNGLKIQIDSRSYVSCYSQQHLAICDIILDYSSICEIELV